LTNITDAHLQQPHRWCNG